MYSEISYMKMLNIGCSPQEARTALNQSTKSSIFVKTNIREMLHIISMRAESHAHPEIQRLFIPVALELSENIDVAFDSHIDRVSKLKEEFHSKNWLLASINK